MSFLDQITTGKQIGAQVHVVTGNNGIGKTTFAASFPGPLIIDLEKGSEHLDVPRIPSSKIPTFQRLRDLLKDLVTTSHDYKTLTIDSVESVETLINQAVCEEGKVKSVEDYSGGYGKGYVRARDLMKDLFSDLRVLQEKGITTILTAHTQVKAHTDPASNQTYDRVIMRANDKLASVVRDLADNVFYATHKVFTTEVKNKTQAFSNGQRVLLTQWRAGHDAKNRLDLPYEIPLSFDSFKEACEKKADTKSTELIASIEESYASMDEKLCVAVKTQVEKFKSNPDKLREIQNRIITLQNK